MRAFLLLAGDVAGFVLIEPGVATPSGAVVSGLCRHCVERPDAEITNLVATNLGMSHRLLDPATIASGGRATSVTVHPSGKFAYAVNGSPGDNVLMYTINATTGALTSTGTVAAGSSPVSIAIHPSGHFVYVTNSGSNNVSMYGIDATTGALTLIGTVGT